MVQPSTLALQQGIGGFGGEVTFCNSLLLRGALLDF